MKFLFDLWFHGILIHKISKWSDQSTRRPLLVYIGVRLLVMSLHKSTIFGKISEFPCFDDQGNPPTIHCFIELIDIFVVCFVSNPASVWYFDIDIVLFEIRIWNTKYEFGLKFVELNWNLLWLKNINKEFVPCCPWFETFGLKSFTFELLPKKLWAIEG